MTRRVAVLVTGSRRWTDTQALGRALMRCYAPATNCHSCVVIHGDASGADTIADNWAFGLGIPTLPMPAQWDFYGRAAGPRRNESMVEVLTHLKLCGYVCHVLACPLPGSRGTHHCAHLAQEAGFVVEWVTTNAE